MPRSSTGCAVCSAHPASHAETAVRHPKPLITPLSPLSLSLPRFQGNWTKFLYALGILVATATQPVLCRLSIDGMPLPMAFELSTSVVYLFEDLPTRTQGQFAAACIVTCILGLVCVILKVIRRYVEKWLVSQENAGRTKVIFGSFPVYANGVRFLVAFVNYSWDYMLMLLAMTFNVGIFISLLLGIALGFFLLGDLLSVQLGPTKKPWTPCQCPNHPCYKQQETGEGTIVQRSPPPV